MSGPTMMANIESAVLPLLYEPLQPPYGHRLWAGWNRITTHTGRGSVYELVRNRADDARGAEIQHAIARYVIGGARREACAKSLFVSPRYFNQMLSGASWGGYTRPLLLAFDRLGIAPRGGRYAAMGTRAADVGRAALRVLDVLAQFADGADLPRDSIDQAVADARLLTYGGVEIATHQRYPVRKAI